MPVAVLSEYPAVSATGEGKRGEWEERGRLRRERGKGGSREAKGDIKTDEGK